MPGIAQTSLPSPVQGKADWRKYKAFRLENGVTCLVINDKESKTTAMSCVVEVGAASDPRELSGLPHFCEHMCFLGSEKYPGENEYKRYLASHGGRSNASTSMHLTNYKFEILADHAEKAVDIFSNFFVAPLFTSSGTEREVQAVNSENSKNLTADGRRRLQILKDIADPLHYYSKFSTGNKETLPTDDPEKVKTIREALLAFHRRHYRPEKMTVVIAGPQSIQTLEDWVGERYSRITSTKSTGIDSEDVAAAAIRSQMEELVSTAAVDAPPYAFDEAAPPYNPAFKASLLQPEQTETSNGDSNRSWPVLLTTKPLRSMRKLNMMFPIPSDRKTPDRSPSAMLSHLLGHEGVGSAFATLQNEGLLSSLSAGGRVRAPDFTLFQIDMGLTEEGEKRWKEVVGVIFAYCRLLQKEARAESDSAAKSVTQGSLKRIWKEKCELGKIFFHETSPGGTYGYTPSICGSVVTYGTETCLSAGSMLNETEETFPLSDFVEFTGLFTPENCIVERCSEGAYKEMEREDTDRFPRGFGLKKEKWYGVEYFLTPIENKLVSEWESGNLTKHEELSLPSPNRYIPRTLELCPELPVDARKGPRIEKPIDPPSLLVDDENWKLFHRLDDRYALPKSSLYLLNRNMSLHNTKNDSGKWVYDERSSLLSSLLAGVFNEAMAQETYDADLAGSHWSLSITSTGLKLSCFGFSDRLPDLALKVLDDFFSGAFLTDEKFFVSTKDRVVRGLRTYFKSRRADSHAMYYRNVLLSSKDQGVNETLEIALALTFEDLVRHHQTILEDKERSVQCLFSGNVNSTQAITFFSSAKSIIQTAYKMNTSEKWNDPNEILVDPGLIERQLKQGEDIELHFSSQNAQEENGAVLCTFQSSIPSFKGETLSHPLALHSSSAIRLLCHIMREPLFNSLRTKQQLGYIVSSGYEIGISSQSNESGQIPLTTPVDFIYINILSQKMAPPDIVDRIDEFIQAFRKSLEEMPESEIIDHADSLSTKLVKPIQKLQSEAALHYSRIVRYGPEVHRSSGAQEIPWNTTQMLASTIRELRREDLLKTFDTMTHPSTRCRVVSSVYGKKFPLKQSTESLKVGNTNVTSASQTTPNYLFSSKPFLSLLRGESYYPKTLKTTKIVDNFPELIKYRSALPHFNPNAPSLNPTVNAGMLSKLQKHHRRAFMVGLGLFGATIFGVTMINHFHGDKQPSPKVDKTS
jgi:insulysin